jgi:hypothetical protein
MNLPSPGPRYESVSELRSKNCALTVQRAHWFKFRQIGFSETKDSTFLAYGNPDDIRLTMDTNALVGIAAGTSALGKPKNEGNYARALEMNDGEFVPRSSA